MKRKNCRTCTHTNCAWRNSSSLDSVCEYYEQQRITIGMLEDIENTMIRASKNAGLTRNQLLDTLFEKGVLAVYNLGMQHMYEYLEE